MLKSKKTSASKPDITKIKVKASKYDKLPAKREAFARAKAAGMTNADAYRHAGYAKGDPHVVANHPSVARRVAELIEYNSGPEMVDKGYLIHQLMETIEAAKRMDWDPEEGKFVPSDTYSLSAANAALKMLGDAIGAWKPTKQVTTTHSSQFANKEIELWAKKYNDALEIKRAVDDEIGEVPSGLQDRETSKE